jgi:hypothetical protein
MSVIWDAFADGSGVLRDRSDADTGARSARAAWLGTCLLLLASPFEGLEPFLRLPGQALSSVETVLVVVFAAWMAACAGSRALPVWRTPLTWPWVAFLCAAVVSALASADRTNALHMSGRFALALGVYLLTVNGVSSAARLRGVITAAGMAGVIVALLVVLEYAGVDRVTEALRLFRANAAHVGAQLRAGGPFQYPTIASMYLEVVFALTLGLLMLLVGAGRKRIGIVLAIALALMSEAVALTFTRAGFMTLASSLALVAAIGVRHRIANHGPLVLAGVACVIGVQFLTSRTVESLRLRLTTEGQNAWYHAAFDVPSEVTLTPGGVAAVPVTVTNTGYSAWDPHAPNRFRLSYHWLLAGEDRVVSWEGARTDLPSVVQPGDSVGVIARVVAPRQPGQYRLMWDIEQEDRLWFSTEPDAEIHVSRATVSGPAVEVVDPSQFPALPTRAVRPGRLVLWRAAGRMAAEHPLLGVGPDNYRLRYGGYAGLPGADPRVHANNMYLEVLTGGGIVMAIPFAWLFWSAATRALAVARRATDSELRPLAAGVVAAAAAIAVHGLVDSFLSFTATYVLIAIALGLVVAADRLSEAHAHRV